MKIDLWTKGALWIIVVLLILNFFQNIFVSKQALAIGEGEGMGRYQISSWAAYRGTSITHVGYYVLDTATGRMVEKRDIIHTREDEERFPLICLPSSVGGERKLPERLRNRNYSEKEGNRRNTLSSH
jgi:hypothetical protein